MIYLYKSEDFRHRVNVWINSWIGLVDSLIFICSFSLIYTNFQMEHLGGFSIRRIERTKSKKGII